MKTTTKMKIQMYLRNKSGWVSGTELEDQAHEWMTKASVIARRAQELAHDGKISKRLSLRKTVEYNYHQPMNAEAANSFLATLTEHEKATAQQKII